MNVECKDVLINVDNQGAINLAKNPVNHQRSKHIDIKYHFIRSEIAYSAGNSIFFLLQDPFAVLLTEDIRDVIPTQDVHFKKAEKKNTLEKTPAEEARSEIQKGNVTLQHVRQ